MENLKKEGLEIVAKNIVLKTLNRNLGKFNYHKIESTFRVNNFVSTFEFVEENIYDHKRKLPLVVIPEIFAGETLNEQILNDFSEEDRDTFGDLPLPKLRALHQKLNQNNQRLAVANNPAVPANEVPQDWTKMDRNTRSKNWDKIIARYRK